MALGNDLLDAPLVAAAGVATAAADAAATAAYFAISAEADSVLSHHPMSQDSSNECRRTVRPVVVIWASITRPSDVRSPHNSARIDNDRRNENSRLYTITVRFCIICTCIPISI